MLQMLTDHEKTILMAALNHHCWFSTISSLQIRSKTNNELIRKAIEYTAINQSEFITLPDIVVDDFQDDRFHFDKIATPITKNIPFFTQLVCPEADSLYKELLNAQNGQPYFLSHWRCRHWKIVCTLSDCVQATSRERKMQSSLHQLSPSCS